MSDRSNGMSIMLTAKDVSASVSHYVDKLGFTLDESWPSAEAPMWASLSLHGQTVMVGGEPTKAGCGEGPEADFFMASGAAFKKAAGGGMMIYLQVPDVDAYHADITKRGAKPAAAPRNEFYGMRDFPIQDLDGYRLCFYHPLIMESCQSCGMPLSDSKPGDMYCSHCLDDTGHLRPFEAIFEGTVAGYFMGMQKMQRAEAEVAAQKHLASMPAWVHHFANQ